MRLGGFAVVAWLVATSPLCGQANPTSDDKAGRLNQDVVTLRLSLESLNIRIVPLEDQILSLLAPDASTALTSLLDRKRATIDSIAARTGIREAGILLVAFFAKAPETRFDPQSIRVDLNGKILYPIAVLPLSASFSSRVLELRGQATGLILFDQPIPVKEPFTIEYDGTRNDDWKNRLTRLDMERARISGPPGVNREKGER